MPVITLYLDELEKLVGERRERIIEKLPMLGCDIERIEEDHIDVEFFPNRPDLYSVEGVARALRGFLGIEKGYKNYEVKRSNWKIFVDENVSYVRPRILGCVARNLKMSDELIRSLMEVQEDLHWTIGRNRRRMAIGIHDLSKVNFPLTYKAVDESFSFIPLDFDKTMSVAEILKEHPKGKLYSFILEGKDRFPMIVDAKGEAISFPPIINAEKTRVTENSRDLFVDVTGFDSSVDKALNIVACMLKDRGAEIESIEIIYPERVEFSPDLSAREMEIDRKDVFDLLGFEMSDEELKDALERMRYGCSIGEKVKVMIPPYRADIMHPWDIIEDVAIGYGYEKIKPEYPTTPTVGATHPWNDLRDAVKEIMIGLGFIEVITFTLTNERVMYGMMKRRGNAWTDYVPLMHPLTIDHTIVRTSILPKLLELLSQNKHHEMPQKIFEVGDVVVGCRNKLNLAACITHAKANFSEVRSYVQAVMREMNLKWKALDSDDEAFIAGRRAEIMVEDKKVGVFGEVHPEVLEAFELSLPVVAFEISLSDIFECGELL